MHASRRVALVFGFTFSYALIRYVILHDVAWSNVPLYLVNKSISWSGVFLFGMSLLAHEKGRRRYYGNLAFIAIMAHLIISLMVLDTHYFPKFFNESGRMNGLGESSMLLGLISTLFIGGLFCISLRGGTDEKSTSLRTGWGRAVLWCAMGHVAVMGFVGWLKPTTWYGYLPPISLLSFAMALYFLYARGRKA